MDNYGLISLILGYCFVLLLFRFEFYFGVPKIYLLLIIGILCLKSFSDIYQKYKIQKPKYNINSILYFGFLATFPFLLMDINGIAIIDHFGPDLLGYLLSSSYQLNGGTYSSLLKEFTIVTHGSTSWWQPLNAWNHPDFRTAVSFEFFFRGPRVGAPAISSFISSFFSIDVWISHNLAIAFSIFFVGLSAYSLLTYKKIQAFVAILASSSLMLSPIVATIFIEAIHAQLISMGLYLALLIYLYINFDKDFKFKIVWPLSLILISAASIYGEGFQIFAFSSFCIAFISIIISLLNLKKINYIFLNFALLGIYATLIDIFFTGIFLGHTFLRATQGFPGGLFHLPQSILSHTLPILLPIRLDQDGIHIINLIPNTHIEISVLVCTLALGIYLLYKYEFPWVLFTFSAFIPPMVLKNMYAIFKVGSLYSPFLFLMIIIYLYNYRKKFTIIIFTIYSLISLYITYSISLNAIVSSNLIPINSLLFLRSNAEVLKDVAIISNSTDHNKLLVGMYAPIYYLNSTWGANYLLNDKFMLSVTYFDDCNLTKKGCGAAQETSKPKLIDIERRVSDFIDINGVSDQAKIKIFVKDMNQ